MQLSNYTTTMRKPAFYSVKTMLQLIKAWILQHYTTVASAKQALKSADKLHYKQ